MIESRPVVTVLVPAVPRDQRPRYRRSLGPYAGSRLRVSDGNRKLTEYEVGLLIANQSEPRQDQTPVPEASATDLDPVAVDGYVARLRASRPAVFGERSGEDVLLRTNVLAVVEDRVVPTLAGLLSFGVYPPLANALIHRDLSVGARGTQVQVEMYPDRLIIRNAGGLYGPIGIDDLGLTGTSSSRNRSLLKILADTPAEQGRTVCENVGSGIFTMRRALADAGMQPPDFRDNISTFEVAFPNHTLLDADTLAWIMTMGIEGLNGPQLIALALAKRGVQLTNNSFRAATGVADSREAGRLMKDLVDRGALAMTGNRGTATYGFQTSPTPLPLSESTHPERNILALLSHGPRTRSDLEAATGMPRATVLYHLRRLREAGQVELVGKERSKTARWRSTGTGQELAHH